MEYCLFDFPICNGFTLGFREQKIASTSRICRYMCQMGTLNYFQPALFLESMVI